MSVYAVIFRTPAPGEMAEIKARFPKHFPFSDTVILIDTDYSAAEAIATDIGMSGSERRSDYPAGLVIRLTASYWGHAPRELWGWLSEAIARG